MPRNIIYVAKYGRNIKRVIPKLVEESIRRIRSTACLYRHYKSALFYLIGFSMRAAAPHLVEMTRLGRQISLCLVKMTSDNGKAAATFCRGGSVKETTRLYSWKTNSPLGGTYVPPNGDNVFFAGNFICALTDCRRASQILSRYPARRIFQAGAAVRRMPLRICRFQNSA